MKHGSKSSQHTWDDIPSALNSLAGLYQDDENMEFVRDVGVLFGGLFNRFEAPDTWQAVTGEGVENYPARQWVYVRPGNLYPNYFLGEDRDSNIHHWALNYDADVSMGNAGVNLGRSWGQKSIGRIVQGLYVDLALSSITSR